MNANQPDPLDNLLRQWAKDKELSDNEPAELTSRIVRALREQPPTSEPHVVGRVDASRSPLGVRAAMAAAAAVLIAIALFSFGPPDHGVNPPPDSEKGLPPKYAWLQESQLREKRLLLREMESMFDGQLAWMLENGDNVQVGISKHGIEKSARSVTVRVIAERRRVGESKWTVVWAADVIARNEEVVRLKPDATTDFALWAFVLPDGTISTDVELTLPDAEEVSFSTSSVLEEGTPLEVHSTSSGSYEFRLIETAAVL